MNKDIGRLAKTELLAETLNSMDPSEEENRWYTVAEGFVKGPGTVGVMLHDNHDSDPRHLDLNFILNVSVENFEKTSITDCVVGVSDDSLTATQQAFHMWSYTTAAVVFEFLTHQGTFASHLTGEDEAGFPGWHMIASDAIGMGIGEEARQVEDWFLRANPWRTLAPLIEEKLDREQLNGIKYFLGSADSFSTAEVRINGMRHEDLSDALLAMDWPRTSSLSMVRTFTLLVARTS